MAKNNKQSFKDLLRYSMPSGIGLTKKERKAADRYGIDFNSYGYNHPDGRNSANPKRDPKNLDADIAARANNDYDTRRSVEAAALSGKKKAEGFAERGFSGLEDVTKANNMFRRMHGRFGNGGDFSSQSDYSGLTYDLVKQDREQLTAKNFKDDFIDKKLPPRENSDTEIEIPSATSGDATAGDNSIASSISQINGIDIAGDRNSVDQNNSIDQDQAGSFLDKYKLNLRNNSFGA